MHDGYYELSNQWEYWILGIRPWFMRQLENQNTEKIYHKLIPGLPIYDGTPIDGNYNVFCMSYVDDGSSKRPEARSEIMEPVPPYILSQESVNHD
jgi:hypothetical protein